MEATQSENRDNLRLLTHSGRSVLSENEYLTCSSRSQYVETGEASARLGITCMDIDDLYEAAVEGKIEDFKKYENRPLEQLVTPNKNTILHIHITAQSKKETTLEFVKKILEMCPDLLWQVNNKHETLLHIAARHGHDDIVKFLISKSKETHHIDQEKGVGAARQMLRMTNKVKDTALHEAVRFNHINVVERLLKEDCGYSYGANEAGETPLYLAVERGYHDIVNMMTSFTGTPLAYDGPIGRTALHAAVISKDLGMTTTILEKEGNLRKRKDKRGWIPLHYAAYYGYIHIVKELLDNDKSTAYIKTGNDEKTDNEKKTDSKTDNEEKTALHIAASRGNVDIMKELISRCPGSSELVDKRGWNVLHFAMKSKKSTAIKLVLENPSLSNLINEYNDDGNTPLHQLASLGLNMTSFIDHPKVDKLAFNEQHLNALDITLDEDVRSREQKYLMYWLKNKGFREGQRVKQTKKKEGQPVEVNKDAYNSEAKCPCSDDEKGKKKDSSLIANIDEAKGAHLVVATLIATVTFAAGFTVPGGYKDEGSPEQGTALLTRSAAFKAFVITDTIAMMLSSSAVIFHLFTALDRQKARCIRHFIIELQFIIWATFSMVIAFVTGTYTILAPSSTLAITACVLGCQFFLLYLYFSSEFMFDFLDLLSEKATSLRSRSFEVFRGIRIVGFLCKEVVRKVLSK